MDTQDRESGATKPETTTDDAQISEKTAATETVDTDTKVSDLKEDAKESIKKKHAKKCAKSKAKKGKTSKKKKKNKSRDADSDSSDSDSEASSANDTDDEESDSESEVEVKKRKGSSKKAALSSSKLKKAAKLKNKKKKVKKSKTDISDSDEDSSSDSSSSSSSDDDDESDGDEAADGKQDKKGKADLQKTLESIQQQLQLSQLQQQQTQARLAALTLNPTPQVAIPQVGQLNNLAQLQLLNQQQLLNQGLPNQLTNQQLLNTGTPPPGSSRARRPAARRNTPPGGSSSNEDSQEKRSKKDASGRKGGLGYKRVDWVWDSTIHTWKLQDTAEVTDDSQYEGYLFHVRRTFDWEGKYKATFVDIKSKPLRECLQNVIGNIKGLSLVEETPKIDPNILFLYLDDLRAYLSTLKTAKPTGATRKERKREEKRNNLKRRHLKVLVKYIDLDYAKVKKSLYPMLENGLITFDLLWALWKPGTLIYSSTYGTHDEPRAFKVDMAEKHYSMMRGNFYWIDGKYLEYDGKQFGFGSMSVEIADFQGARKITSLSCYPLEYHKSEARTRETLIARGKKFVQLSGVHYKNHQGMAFFKKKKSVVKVNINGRIMVDPAIHRRINPNYPISVVRPKDHDIVSDDDDSDAGSSCCCVSDSEEEARSGSESQSDDKPKYVTKAIKDKKGNICYIKVRKEDDETTGEKLEAVPPAKNAAETLAAAAEAAKAKRDKAAEEEKSKIPEFSDEEYLIASPVVLGFAFSEKMWLEFTVSGIKEIQWNENAYESLVLESKKKEIVKALVESHKYHAAESIDDVIQGKGKGLVAVLHGPPGTGKTLTAEGISELLKCPLYMASAGELGTDSRYLEQELQKILDICHAWGAILLLDEADVFLEKRNMHDIHRNALVSIFLRQLEYFQGILFLTTNRVETFDDAFQSRIHIGLRYDALEPKAKRSIFKIFVERVRVLENIDTMPFTEEDFADLAKHDLNGRQIKNTVRTAQALAVNKGEALSMAHIRQVLDVLMSFDRDLKGGTGYQEAMRSYF